MDKTTRDAALKSAAALGTMCFSPVIEETITLLKAIGTAEPTTDADVLAAIDRLETAAQIAGYETRAGGSHHAKADNDATTEARTALITAISLRGTVRSERTLRNGATVVILCEDAPGDCPIVGYWYRPDKTQVSALSWTAEGQWLPRTSIPNEWDLMPLPVAEPDGVERMAERLYVAGCKARKIADPMPWANAPGSVREMYTALARAALELEA